MKVIIFSLNGMRPEAKESTLEGRYLVVNVVIYRSVVSGQRRWCATDFLLSKLATGVGTRRITL